MNSTPSPIKVALADDHIVLRDGLAALVNQFDNCQVIFTASNGIEVQEAIQNNMIPDVLILDLTMPDMDGYETAVWLGKKCPSVRVLMLTMYDAEIIMIRLLQAGARGFLKKDIHPRELKLAIRTVVESGFYYSDIVTGKLVNLFLNHQDDTALKKSMFTEDEVQFLKLCCAEGTYKDIAKQMKISPRMVDTLRETLCERLEVKSRVGLAMCAIRHGLHTF
jgi:two-component system, NarL family, invasion response regulator UvrY